MVQRFKRAQQGFGRREDVFARCTEQLSDDAIERAARRAKTMPVEHLDYDWSLDTTGR